MTRSSHPRFERLVGKAKTLQARLMFLPTVAVGGTAVALYAKHRVSLDVDFVSPLLSARFDNLSTTGALTAFAEAAHDVPVDEDDVDLESWRSLDPAYRNLAGVIDEVRDFAVRAVEEDAIRRGLRP